MSAPAAYPRLVVTGGPLDGSVVDLAAPGTARVMGTGERCDLRVQAGHIEPEHASVYWTGEQLLLSDLGSVAGTYVNGEKVGADHALSDGDRVCLGPPGFKGSVKMVASLPASMPAPDDSGGLQLASEPADGDEPLLLDPAVFGLPPLAGMPSAGGDDFVLDSTEQRIHVDPGPDLNEPWAPHGGTAPVVTIDPSLEDEAPPFEAAPEPETAPPSAFRPAPQPVSPAAPAAPAAAVPVPKAAAPHKPEYTSDLPSIEYGGERPTGPSPVPPLVPPPSRTPTKGAAPAAKPRRKGITFDARKTLIINAGVITLAVVALIGWRAMHKPPPVLSDLSPPRARPGQSLTINGTGFDPDAAKNVVHFGDSTAPASTVAETWITVTVPADLARAGAVQVAVAVESHGSRSNALDLRVAHGPAVTGLVPDVALPGATFEIRGTNLAGEGLSVRVGDVVAQVASTSPTALRVVVPAQELVEGRSLNVVVQAAGEQSDPVTLILGTLPLVLSLQPSEGEVGALVRVSGRGFDPDPANDIVTFDGVRALVASATATDLAVVVPAPATPGAHDAPLIVQSRGNSSSGSTVFKLTALSMAVLIPHYYAAPVIEHPGHDHVFVSCALGPVLLLSGRGDAPSTAARAVKVASALNALVRQASTEAVTLETRDAPVPAVAVAGRPDLLVTATPQDTAGYAEGWEGVKGATLAPRDLASYWAALLQDHFTMFIAHERPTRTVQLSPRGRVLLDMYSDTARRGDPTGGIPLPIALSTSYAKALREMALAPGGAGGGQAAAAVVAGTWTGSAVEPGGVKQIEIELRLDGNRLVGRMRSGSGGVSMEQPLTEVAFEKGALRFTVAAGGKSYRFQGTLQGRAISGTIAVGGVGVGQFSLAYAQ